MKKKKKKKKKNLLHRIHKVKKKIQIHLIQIKKKDLLKNVQY